MKFTELKNQKIRRLLFKPTLLVLLFLHLAYSAGPVYSQSAETPTPAAAVIPAISESPPPATPQESPAPTATSTPAPTISAAPSLLPSTPTINLSPSISSILLKPSAITTTLSPLSELPSAGLKKSLKMLPLSKKTFQAREKLSLTVLNDYNSKYLLRIRDSDGRELPVVLEKKKQGNDTLYEINPPAAFRPGRYKISLTDSSGIPQEQSFVWGVLAVNTNKSIYRPQDLVDFSIGVLDENGVTVCNATLLLEITAPSGEKIIKGTHDRSISVFKKCGIKEVNYEPDYFTELLLGEETGRYQYTLTADTRNGTYAVSDFFEVDKDVPFDVERISATRIFPVNQYYSLLKIKAYQDFDGIVKESVPESFEIFPISDPSVRSYDSVSTASANLAGGDILGIQDKKSFASPFLAPAVKTLNFAEIPENPVLQYEYERFGLNSHDGADFALPEGTPLYAVDDGEILQAGNGYYGITVIIKHSWGRTFYGHLRQTTVTVGQKVSKADEIGLSGNTGLSTGPHLHFSLLPNSPDYDNGFFGKVDPLKFLAMNNEGQVAGISTASFQTKEIIWNLKIKSGEEITLGYYYDAPNISPQFYLLGPLKFFAKSNLPLSPVPTATAVPTVQPLQTEPVSTDSAAITEASSSASPTPSDNQLPIPPQRDPASGGTTNYELIFEEARRWQIAVDTDVEIDLTASTLTTGHDDRRKLVFVSDQVGYIFYINSGGPSDCPYRKTIDGGASWSNETNMSTGFICSTVSVWYDQWTPSDLSGNYIHVAMIDETTNQNQIYYQRLDTSNDALITATNIASSTTINQNDFVTITKSTGGLLYYGVSDADGGKNIKQCTASTNCDAAGEWTNAGTAPLDNAIDPIMLFPLSANNIMIVRDDISTEDLQYRIWNGTDWNTPSNVWTNIDVDAADNTSYRHNFSATVRRYNNQIYLNYVAGPGNTNADIRTAVYDGSNWTAKTEVLSNNSSVVFSDIALDEESGDVYVAYSRGTAGTSTNVYYKKSTDGMNTWSNEVQLNTNITNSDIRSTWLNVVDSDRIYYAYWSSNTDDIYGGTLADLTPPLLTEILKHGEWFSMSGKRKPFSF